MTTSSTLPTADASPPTTYDVTGMTCAACARHVERALRHAPGVASAEVNFATAQAQVTFTAAPVDPRELTAVVEAAGYGLRRPSPRASDRTDEERRERRQLVGDLVLASAATLPLLVLAMSHGAIPWADGTVGRVVQMGLGSVVLFGPGRRFLGRGLQAAQRRRADMNTLVALGATAAWLYSMVSLIAPAWSAHGEHAAAPHVYFEAAAAIVTFVLFGKFLESRARWQLGDALRGLHALVPAMVTRRAGDGTETAVPLADLAPGDEIVVRPGERVPSDGRVVQGESALDQSMLSGESVPVDKATGDRVFGGTLNTTGRLVVRVEQVGADTALARITDAVAAAQGSRAPIARLADRASAVFVPIVLLIALATFAVWWLVTPTSAGLAVAVERMVAVLVIACPCALGLATPAAVAVGAGRGADLGVLFRNGTALEAASDIDTVFVDKTGTLTSGRPALRSERPEPGVTADDLLRAAAAVELASEHPFAHAITAAARARGIAIPAIDGFRASAAAGVAGTLDGVLIRVGKASWLAEHGIDVRAATTAADEMAHAGQTPLFVARGTRLLGLLGVADPVLPEARTAVDALRARGIEVVMLTGDRAAVAKAIARSVGIERVEADLLPTDKARIVADARAAGRSVAMVGDGVNDAPALAAAQVGMAVASATDVTAAAADVVLLRGGIAAVPLALGLARATLATIRRNLVWASLYNILGIPIAAGALYPATGWLLSPILASAAMSLSSVSVLVSSLTLKRFGHRSGAGTAAVE